MGWIWDSGYGPAYTHEGYPVSVLHDGTEVAAYPLRHGTVTGWRAGCDCGWRSLQLWPAAEYPDARPELGPPAEVEGWETSTGAHAEWSAHLAAVLPGLAVHDAAARVAAARDELDRAVATARTAGTSWAVIGEAAGLTRQAAHERWGTAGRAAPATVRRTR